MARPQDILIPLKDGVRVPLPREVCWGGTAVSDRGLESLLIFRLVQLFHGPTNSGSVFASYSGRQKK
ncbi:MAG: hypothetical protein QOG67_1411 [Verrucomicrobiota bacterium]